MARPLRIEVAGGWYHVMNRGHRGGALFVDDTDGRRFLGAVAELPERFALEVHTFVPALGDDPDRKRFVSKLKRQMSIIEMRPHCIFKDDVDRQDFLKTLAEACQKTGFEVHAYCLMENLFHSAVDWIAQRLEIGTRKSAASQLHDWDRQKQDEGSRPTRGKTMG